ncbi:transcription initiation factor TFIID subunit 11-like [Corticium candelabrum]|uniref:transcription initiation factor TFIID subunit 11-like n=1 Tax=Corticium candelabrum TaxID=121492 RepID=UPI002E259999|nr:transcription initiation factor TFIID subunit 11-like [Corticium candelabrum]
MGKKRKERDGAETDTVAQDEPSNPAKLPKTDETKDTRHKQDELDHQQRDRRNMQALVTAFSSEQNDRYEFYRRSAFPRAAIKRLMQNVSGVSVPLNAVIAMAGITKVFVGEVVEEALDVRDKLGDDGPVQPKHLREAVRRLKVNGSVPTVRRERQSFM